MNENNIIENAYSEIRGIPFGVFVGQHDRTDELNDRIFKRNIPTLELEPNFDPRPISTKYSHFPALSGRKEMTVNKKYYSEYDIKSNFNPGNAKAPPSGILNNIEHETYLRNQYFALQKGDKQYYVPTKSSELYNDNVVSTDTTVQPHPGLFKIQTFTNNRTTYGNLNVIGKDLFNNNTRTQMRGGL
tara:strand:+ start:82 stop:642 length:561 start_codon:yes stop_codon:yes gene_type:complete